MATHAGPCAMLTGRMRQVPLALAWAISIHKSQANPPLLTRPHTHARARTHTHTHTGDAATRAGREPASVPARTDCLGLGRTAFAGAVDTRVTIQSVASESWTCGQRLIFGRRVSRRRPGHFLYLPVADAVTAVGAARRDSLWPDQAQAACPFNHGGRLRLRPALM